MAGLTRSSLSLSRCCRFSCATPSRRILPLFYANIITPVTVREDNYVQFFVQWKCSIPYDVYRSCYLLLLFLINDSTYQRFQCRLQSEESVSLLFHYFAIFTLLLLLFTSRRSLSQSGNFVVSYQVAARVGNRDTMLSDGNMCIYIWIRKKISTKYKNIHYSLSILKRLKIETITRIHIRSRSSQIKKHLCYIAKYIMQNIRSKFQKTKM